MYSMLAFMGHLGYCINCTFTGVSLPSNVDKGQSDLIYGLGMTGLEKSDRAMKNIWSKLMGYYNFADPNDRVLKNNILFFMET